jgi:hypothetical protein
VIISILCNYQQKGVKIFISEILTRLKELVPEETLRGKYIRQVCFSSDGSGHFLK